MARQRARSGARLRRLRDRNPACGRRSCFAVNARSPSFRRARSGAAAAVCAMRRATRLASARFQQLLLALGAFLIDAARSRRRRRTRSRPTLARDWVAAAARRARPQAAQAYAPCASPGQRRAPPRPRRGKEAALRRRILRVRSSPASAPMTYVTALSKLQGALGRLNDLDRRRASARRNGRLRLTRPRWRTPSASCAAGLPAARRQSSSACAWRRAPFRTVLAVLGRNRAAAMLESAEIGHRIAKRVYAREEPKLREALLNAQFDLSQSGSRPGPARDLRRRSRRPRRDREQADRVDGSAAHPRRVAFGPRTAEEIGAPAAVALLARAAAQGQARHLHERLVQRGGARRTCAARSTAGRAACTLAVDPPARADADRRRHRAAQVLDPPVARRTRRSGCEALDRDPRTRWRVTARTGRRIASTASSHDLWEHLLRETSTGEAPWYVVEGTDDRYRNLTVGKILLDAMRGTLAAKATAPTHAIGAARAVGHRQRQADPRPRPDAAACRASNTSARSRSTRAGSRGSRATSASRRTRWCWCSRASTPPARAARSAASPARSTRAST